MNQNFVSGNNSINIAGDHSSINIDNVQFNQYPKLDEVEYKRINPIPIIKYKTLENGSILGAIGLVISIIASVFQIIDFFKHGIFISKLSPTLFMVIVIFCSILFALGITLRSKFHRTGHGYFGINLDVFEDIVHISRIEGKCPICGGKVRLWSFPNNVKIPIGRCDQNPDLHIFSFDHTTFKGYRLN